MATTRKALNRMETIQRAVRRPRCWHFYKTPEGVSGIVHYDRHILSVTELPLKERKGRTERFRRKPDGGFEPMPPWP